MNALRLAAHNVEVAALCSTDGPQGAGNTQERRARRSALFDYHRAVAELVRVAESWPNCGPLRWPPPLKEEPG